MMDGTREPETLVDPQMFMVLSGILRKLKNGANGEGDSQPQTLEYCPILERIEFEDFTLTKDDLTRLLMGMKRRSEMSRGMYTSTAPGTPDATPDTEIRVASQPSPFAVPTDSLVKDCLVAFHRCSLQLGRKGIPIPNGKGLDHSRASELFESLTKP